MRFTILTVFLFSLTSFSSANEMSKKISEYVSGFIPGEGDTEVSLDIRENYKPDFSFLAVREVKKTLNGNIFTQFSLTSTERNNDGRLVGNIGLGKRFLNDNKTLMTGYNSFFDYDQSGNKRVSLGYEAESAVLEFGANYYKRIQDGDENVMSGYDLRLASQIPHLHWADIFVDTYSWDKRNRFDIKGTKIGSEMLLSPNTILELAYDNKNKTSLEDEWYAKIQFIHPPRSGYSLQDGFFNKTKWKDQKDMSGELLTKVKRNNKIMVEFKGLATISRTD